MTNLITVTAQGPVPFHGIDIWGFPALDFGINLTIWLQGIGEIFLVNQTSLEIDELQFTFKTSVDFNSHN